jgi:hypothetical protein
MASISSSMDTFAFCLRASTWFKTSRSLRQRVTDPFACVVSSKVPTQTYITLDRFGRGAWVVGDRVAAVWQEEEEFRRTRRSTSCMNSKSARAPPGRIVERELPRPPLDALRSHVGGLYA